MTSLFKTASKTARFSGRSGVLVAFGLAFLLISGCQPQQNHETQASSGSVSGSFLVEARIIDGTGSPEVLSRVRVDNARVTEIGTQLEPLPGETFLRVPSRVLAPGFIDTHSHHDLGLDDDPGAEAAISQGITTVIVGQDGGSHTPLADWFDRREANPATVNIASYSGHNTLRSQVLKGDQLRPATQAEIQEMANLLRQDMEAGALGFGTGLEYEPGINSTTEEVVQLATVAAEYGGRYISHIRSEDRAFWPAIEEILEVGQRADLPVQISHLKLAMLSNHGQTDRLLERLNAARSEGIEVTADLYPYTYWQSTLLVLFPERDYESLAAAQFAITELAAPDGIRFGQFAPEPEYAGLTLAEVANLRSQSPAAALLDLVAMAREAYDAQSDQDGTQMDVENIIATSMTDSDIEGLLQWPHLNFCSDGGLKGEHPRGFGSFPRFFGHYVRERSALSLEEAVRRATQLAAHHVGLKGRGTIEVGQIADLTLFSPETIEDQATIDEPHLSATGIEKVWVSGELVYNEGSVLSARPGKTLRRN